MIDFNNFHLSSDSEISQDLTDCFNMLITTPAGTVALDREYGLDMSFVDMPLNRAKQMYCAEVITKTRKYTPRIRVNKILFTQEPINGTSKPIIYITHNR